MEELVIERGDVLAVWGSGLIDKGIEAVEHGGPSHVALFINATTVEEAQGGRTVGECDLSFYTSSNAHLEVWTDPTLTEDERDKMVAFARTLYGKNYDYVLIPLELLHAECGLPIGWYHNDNALICSGDLEKCAESVNRRWSEEPEPTPADLLRGGVLKKKAVMTACGLVAA